LVVAGFSLRLEALACGKQRNLKVATTSLRLEALFSPHTRILFFFIYAT